MIDSNIEGIEGKFESIEEIRMYLSIEFSCGCDIYLIYKGKDYRIDSRIDENKQTSYYFTNSHVDYETMNEYETLDELLDNEHIDGSPLRQIILEMDVEELDYSYNGEWERLHKKPENLAALHEKLVDKDIGLQLSYNGKEYFIDHFFRKGVDVYTIAADKNNETRIEYTTFDDMLDQYKEEGIALRDFILDMYIEFEY